MLNYQDLIDKIYYFYDFRNLSSLNKVDIVIKKQWLYQGLKFHSAPLDEDILSAVDKPYKRRRRENDPEGSPKKENTIDFMEGMLTSSSSWCWRRKRYNTIKGRLVLRLVSTLEKENTWDFLEGRLGLCLIQYQRRKTHQIPQRESWLWLYHCIGLFCMLRGQ